MNNAASIFAIVFLPFSLLFFGIGIYKTVYAVKLNNEINKRERAFVITDAVVKKCIIREALKYVGSGRSDAGYSKAEYEVYLDVEYNIKGNVMRSFGFYKKVKTIQDALLCYENFPNKPELIYQQKNNEENETRNNVIDILKNYKLTPSAGVKNFTIKYSAENPAVNQLTTKQKKTFAGIIFVYGFGIVIGSIYVIFCLLSKAGPATGRPLFLCAVLLLIFLIYRIYSTQVSIDTEPLPEAGFEMHVTGK